MQSVVFADMGTTACLTRLEVPSFSWSTSIPCCSSHLALCCLCLRLKTAMSILTGNLVVNVWTLTADKPYVLLFLPFFSCWSNTRGVHCHIFLVFCVLLSIKLTKHALLCLILTLYLNFLSLTKYCIICNSCKLIMVFKWCDSKASSKYAIVKHDLAFLSGSTRGENDVACIW